MCRCEFIKHYIIHHEWFPYVAVTRKSDGVHGTMQCVDGLYLYFEE